MPKHATAETESEEVQGTTEPQNKTVALKNFVDANKKVIGAFGIATAAFGAFTLAYKNHQTEETPSES